MAVCPFSGIQNDAIWHASGICHITSGVTVTHLLGLREYVPVLL